MEAEVCTIIQPQTQKLPVVISVPHSGTLFPDSLKNEFETKQLQTLDDTDWFVDKLYSFGPSLGMPILKANYSRWVIDLNRDPQSKPLYTDGRVITALCPATDFMGNPLYKDKRNAVAQEEVNKRLAVYYTPYHQQLQNLISATKAQFGYAILWDCHSIRSHVSAIRPTRFPDLILGTADETSASASLIQQTLSILKKSKWQVSHNNPFKGGYITRQYGKPHEQIHALQLEMCKDIYLNDSQTEWHSERAGIVQSLLQETLFQLAHTRP
jgi:N-formylglutamate deformylase